MVKHAPLSEDELGRFRMNADIARHLEEFARERALRPDQVRVLDYGCGRGEIVAWLHTRGYRAFGVDIDRAIVEHGRPALAERGIDAERALTSLEPDGRIPHADGVFDFVCSEQVLEHVADLDRVARELGRVTAPGGAGIHCLPGPWRIVEVHLHMPLVHWLPKNGLRRAAIWVLLALGFDPGARRAEGRSLSERTRIYYEYSVERTYYRGCRRIREAFERAGFGARFVTIDNVEIRKRRWLVALLRPAPVRAAAHWLLRNFRLVELYTTRSSSSEAKRVPSSTDRISS